MASIKQLDERRYKITVSNGYRPNGKKISKAKTIQVPSGVPKRGIGQYVAHAAEELERSFKTGYAEDGEMTFEEFASRWLKRQGYPLNSHTDSALETLSDTFLNPTSWRCTMVWSAYLDRKSVV